MNETFVGNYVFSDEELARVYDFTGCLLRNYDGGWGNSISQGYDELVFVAMVNAVKLGSQKRIPFGIVSIKC